MQEWWKLWIYDDGEIIYGSFMTVEKATGMDVTHSNNSLNNIRINLQCVIASILMFKLYS